MLKWLQKAHMICLVLLRPCLPPLTGPFPQVSLVASPSTCLPAPQDYSTTPAPQAADYGDDYGDYDQESKVSQAQGLKAGRL